MANAQSPKGSITTDPTDIKSMIRKYHEQNHAHKFYSSDKMDRFLSHNLSTLTQEDTDNPNNSISSKKNYICS